MKILTKGLKIVLFFSICGIALSAVQPSKHLTVKEIVISGNDRINISEIVERSDIKAGSTSMLFSSSGVRKRILENPWIGDISVKKFLHGKIVIKISENEPFCVVIPEGEKPYYVNRKGKRLGVAEMSQASNLPLVSGEEKISQDLLLQAIEILDLSKSSSILEWSEISRIVVEENFGIKLLTMDRRFINFGKNNMTSKWRKIERIIVHARKKNLVEKYIDISSGEVGLIGYDS